MAKKLMFQGTSSDVGKSVLCTALCRILKRKGLKVSPFKAQNMALNSYVTKAGDEIGRAQVAQAEAAGIEPIVQMQPVLLKPTGNQSSQVVLMGKPVGVMSAQDYHKGYSLKALDKVKESLRFLDANFDVLVIEGAGSPAEVNLKKNDIVNMRIARMTNAPVFLIADIDRGGAIASIVGTLELLEPEERDLVKGIVINKFRGDINLLEPALDFIEERTGKKVVGVIPTVDQLDIDEEDSVALEKKRPAALRDIHVAVLQTPKISNFTDFDALLREPDVSVHFIQQGDALGDPDLILLPGSKNTVQDLAYLKAHGYVEAIREKAKAGTPVMGICGGYQMLGKKIFDPEHVESTEDVVEGIGLLPMETTMQAEKQTSQVLFDIPYIEFLGHSYEGKDLVGYEIHMGDTIVTNGAVPSQPFHISRRGMKEVSVHDGYAVKQESSEVLGSYIHGILDNDEFRRFLINGLREKKGLEALPLQFRYFEHKEAAYERLADVVEKHLDMEYIEKVLEEQEYTDLQNDEFAPLQKMDES